MASKLNRIGKDIMSAMKKATEHGTSAYDTTAEVRRIEGDTAWVHIAGGVDETPVKLTVSAKAGDSVQVRVGGGRAWITGNATAPPTDDRQANIATEKAEKADKKVVIVQEIADTAKKIADTARKIAGNTTQYFWHTESGTDTGVHITEKPQEEFLDDPANGGGNLLARSNGIAVRDGLTELATFGGTGMTVNDGTGAPIATFSNSNGEGLIGLQNNEACLLGGYYDEDRVLSMSRYTTKLPDMSPVRSTSIGQTVSKTATELRLYAGGGTNSNKILLNADEININGNLGVSGNITSAISACGAAGTADVALSTSEKKIMLSTSRGRVGSYLSNSDGGVRCAKSGYVEISGGIYFSSGFTNNDIVHAVVKKNSTQVINAAHRLPASYDYYSIPPLVCEVSAGDVLYLYAYNQMGARGYVNATTESWLTVKYL